MSVKRLFTLIFGLALLAMGTREPIDPDLWWHLRTGAVILTDGLPRVDPFSFTHAGAPWIAHEWLADVLLWLVYDAAGLAALSLLFAVIIAVTFWLLFRACAGRPYLAAFVVLLAALTAAPTWGVRPQMFNLLLAAAFVNVVEGFQAGRLRARWLILLPLLTALWANLHSGYLFGVVILGVYAVGAGLTTWFSTERDWRQTQLLAGVTGASFLAALLNPHGPALWLYPFETLGSAAMQRFITEWHAPDFHLQIFWPFAAMIFVSGLSWLFGQRRLTWTEGLFFFGGAAAGLLSARNIPLSAVANAVMLSRHLASAITNPATHALLDEGAPARRTPPFMTVINVVTLLVVLLGAATWMGQRLINIEPTLAQLYPAEAVAYLESTGLAEQAGFNNYAWGGYLIWHEIPVYIDGRADIYQDFLFTYQKTNLAQADWQAPLQQYDVDYILIESGSTLAELLRVSPDWISVYEDELAIIFVPWGGA